MISLLSLLDFFLFISSILFCFKLKEMKSKVEAARDSEKKTKKQLDDVDNERKRLEKALASARDELDSTYVHWREFREIWEGGGDKGAKGMCIYWGLGEGGCCAVPRLRSPTYPRWCIEQIKRDKQFASVLWNESLCNGY